MCLFFLIFWLERDQIQESPKGFMIDFITLGPFISTSKLLPKLRHLRHWINHNSEESYNFVPTGCLNIKRCAVMRTRTIFGLVKR